MLHRAKAVCHFAWQNVDPSAGRPAKRDISKQFEMPEPGIPARHKVCHSAARSTKQDRSKPLEMLNLRVLARQIVAHSAARSTKRDISILFPCSSPHYLCGKRLDIPYANRIGRFLWSAGFTPNHFHEFRFEYEKMLPEQPDKFPSTNSVMIQTK